MTSRRVVMLGLTLLMVAAAGFASAGAAIPPGCKSKQLVTKSGSRDFHGEAYEYFRNAKLDGNTWARNNSPLNFQNAGLATVVAEILDPIAPGLDKDTFFARLQNDIEAATARLIAEGRAKMDSGG